MTVFPQLASGAVAQFPVRRLATFRTVRNELSDGQEITTADVDFEERAWELSFRELSDAEWTAISDLFEQVGGRYESFLFVEPGANLLAWTEDVSAPVWSLSGTAGVAGGVADPLGGLGAATVSGGGSGGTLAQTLAAPASFVYGGSLWAKTGQTGVSLRVTDGPGAVVKSVAIDSTNQWRRYTVSYDGGSVDEQMRFEVVAPAGNSVEIFGPQLEGQAAASAYKRNEGSSGVYDGVRFGDDELPDTLEAPGRHAGSIRLVWTRSQT